MKQNYSLFERAASALAAVAQRHALPIASTLVFGFLAHMYAFTNKLLNADETAALFSKGATVTSGRWGLEVTKLVFPDVSMPWIYGVITLLLISAAVCLTIECFRFKSPVTQLLLSGAFAAFPALTGNLCYMFTSASYALAILLAVLSVYLFTRGGKLCTVVACVALAFSLGIYQAYIALAASFCVVLLIKALLDDSCDAKSVFRAALRYFLLLAASLALYYAVTLIVEVAMDTGYQEYDVTTELNIFRGLLTAYTSFFGIFFSGNFGLVTSGGSVFAHLACALVVLVSVVSAILRGKDAKKTALLLLLLALYPLSVNCMYLIASADIIHTLVLFSFVSFYVLTLVSCEAMTKRGIRALCALAVGLIIVSNVYFANKVYLKMHLEYENAYTFYNSLMVEVMDNPNFNLFTVVDIVGNAESGLTHFTEEIYTGEFVGVNEDLVNTYTRVSFIKYYLGLDLYMYREDTILRCDWYDEMPCYPDDGSILYLGDENRLVVKLS